MVRAFFDLFFVFAGVGMIEALLEPHLSKYFRASQLQVTMVFFTFAASALFSTPFLGYVLKISTVYVDSI